MKFMTQISKSLISCMPKKNITFIVFKIQMLGKTFMVFLTKNADVYKIGM